MHLHSTEKGEEVVADQVCLVQTCNAYGVRTHGIPRLKAQLDASDGMALQIADRHYTATARPRVVTVVLL